MPNPEDIPPPRGPRLFERRLTADDILAVYDASVAIDELERRGVRRVNVARGPSAGREISTAELSRALAALAARLRQS